MALAISFAFALPALAAHHVQVLVEHAVLLDVGAGVRSRVEQVEPKVLDGRVERVPLDRVSSRPCNAKSRT